MVVAVVVRYFTWQGAYGGNGGNGSTWLNGTTYAGGGTVVVTTVTILVAYSMVLELVVRSWITKYGFTTFY